MAVLGGRGLEGAATVRLGQPAKVLTVLDWRAFHRVALVNKGDLVVVVKGAQRGRVPVRLQACLAGGFPRWNIFSEDPFHDCQGGPAERPRALLAVVAASCFPGLQGAAGETPPTAEAGGGHTVIGRLSDSLQGGGGAMDRRSRVGAHLQLGGEGPRWADPVFVGGQRAGHRGSGRQVLALDAPHKGPG